MTMFCSLESTRALRSVPVNSSRAGTAWLQGLVATALLLLSMPGMAALSLDQTLSAADHGVDAPLNLADERFGQSVAVAGNWMAVGSPGGRNGGGSVSIYERVSGAWVRRERVVAPTVQAGSGFGSAVDIHEAGGLVTLIVGAPLFDAAQTDQGRAFVFSDTNAGPALLFSAVATLNAPTPEVNGQFGSTVALFGDLAAIGAPNDGPTDNGLVTIRGRNQGGSNTWGQVGTAKAGPAGSRFGTSVDVHGEYVIVGAPMAENVAGLRTGAAYVYRQDLGGANAFGLKHSLSPSAGQANQAFGQSVGIWDSNLAVADSPSRSMVGAPLFDDGATLDAGRVTFFGDAANQGQFNGPTANGQLGYSVAVEAENALAGRPAQTVASQSNTGQVNTFGFAGSAWATNTINLTQTGASRGYQYGYSVDLSGLVAVIGAPGSREDALNLPPGATRAGIVETLEKPGLTWAKDTDSFVVAIVDLPNTAPNQFFGQDVDMTSEWMVVGVADDGLRGAESGTAYVYRNVAGSWTPHSRLMPQFSAPGDRFGSAVSVHGNRIVVTAPGVDGFPNMVNDSGAFFSFEFNGTRWVETALVTSPNPVASGAFGASIDLQGDVLVVGATGENGNRGRAYAYRNLTSFAGPSTLTLPAASIGSGTGFSVSVHDPAPGTPNDEVIAVGARNESGSQGAAYVLTGASFSTLTTLVDPAPVANGAFGYAVSIDGARVAVGAPGQSSPGGRVIVFSGSGYATASSIPRPTDAGRFGFDVHLSGNSLLVGAPATASNAGAAHRFGFSAGVWSETGPLTPTGLVAGDGYGNSVVQANGQYLAAASADDANSIVNSGAAFLFSAAPEVSVAPTSLSVSEAGPTTGNFTVSLNQAPSSNVTIQLTFSSQVQVDSGSGFGASPQTVTLTPATAVSGVTVAVRAVDDAIAESNPHQTAIVTAATSSAQSRFNGLAVADVDVSIADNDNPGIVVTESGGTTAVVEGGATDTYSVVLGSQPSANVTVNLVFGAQLQVQVGAGPLLSSPASIVFTPANATTPQVVTVVAVDDTVVEGGHSATIVQSVTSTDPLYSAIDPADVTVAVTDNDTAQVGFATPGSSVAETAGNHAVSAILQITANGTPGGSLGVPVVVAPSFTAGTADAADFSATTTSYSFLAGSANGSTAPISVAISNDRLLEGAETFTVTQTVTTGPATASGSHPVTITDDESAAISWSTASGNATEATPSYTGATAQLAVSGSGSGPLQLASGNSVSVALNAVAGTADPTDYTVGASVVFAGGSASGATQVASVGIVNDALVEGNESVQLQFGAAAGAGAISATGAHAITIADNDSAVIGFVPGDDTVGEADGSFSKVVVLSLTTNGSGPATVQRAIEVPVGTTPQTASTPADYQLTTPSLVFAAGSGDGATRNASISIVDDALAETAENLLLTLGDSFVTPAITRGRAGTLVSIIDNDTPGVTLVQSGGNTSVTEGGVTDSYTLVLNSQPSADVTVAISSGTQLTTAPTSVVFTAANWSTPRTVTVTAVDDAVAEGTHNGSLTHAVTSTDVNYNGLLVDTVSVTITDNDTAGITLTEADGSTAVTEGGATDSYIVVLTSEPVATVTLTATTGPQLSLSTNPLVFTAANWNVPQVVTVSAVNDNVVEGPHTGTLSFAVTSADPAYAPIAVSPITVAITDNDSATVGFSPASVSQSEATSPMVFTVTLSNPVASGVTVSVSTSNGTATAPADYTAITAQTVSFPANSTTAQTVSVAINNDALFEAGETFALTLSNLVATGNVTLGTAAATGMIVNDDAAPTITISAPSVTEGNSGTTPMTFVVSLSAVSGLPVNFNFATGTGTATAGTDFTAIPSTLGTIAAGGTSLTIPVNVLGDTNSEANETVLLNLTGISNANVTSLSGTGTILDDDIALIRIEDAGRTEGNSGSQNLSFTVTRSENSGAFAVSYATANGTAMAGSDYTASTGTLNFSAGGALSQTVEVPITGELLVEVTETFSVTLDTVVNSVGTAEIERATATGTITDNDSATVQFAPVSVSQSEATSPMGFTVTLSNPVQSGVTLSVSTSNGTATAPADYTAITAQTVSFPANSTTAQTVNVSISNDALNEEDEGFGLTLSNLVATGDVTLGTSAATGTIVNDDPLPTLSVSNVTQPEGNASNTLTFTVNLSPVSGRAVSFTRATVDGSAVSTGPNADFVAIPASTVTIPAGQTSVTIPVTINGDTVFEGDQSFTLAISDVANATPGSLTATATLTDDDQQPTTTTIVSDLPDPSVVGQPYPVTVEVRAQTLSPLGTVSITDGSGASCDAALVAGTPPLSTMSCTLTSTSAGARTLTATYTPANDAFAASSDTESHTVNAAATSLVLLGPARARIGTAASYTAELSVTAPGAGTPAGVVTVSAGSNSCTITLPTATPSCTLTYSTLGSRAVSASFAPGNGNFLGSTATPVQTLVFSSSDVSVTKTNAVGTYRPGDLLVYTVIVRNNGPDAAPQVRIRDVAPVGLTNVAWTCEASGGAICPDSGGTGTLDHIVATLPTGGTLTYAYFGNVTGRPLTITNTAEVILPADTTIEDPNPANNSATDTDLLDDLFTDGFEAPGINAESGGVRLAGASLRSSFDDVARVRVRLSDVRGEALRVYVRVVGGELQVALALRAADGTLRLGSWQRPVGDPELTWTATPTAGGFVLSGATLR